MSIIFAFLLGLAVGFIGSWFVWRNNKRKWEALQAKYEKAEAFYDNISKEYLKKKD